VSAIASRFLISLSTSLVWAGGAEAADCGALIANFHSAVADKAFEKVKDAMAAIADDNACNFDIDTYRIQEINSIIDIAGAAPAEGEREQMIDFAQQIIEIGGDWRSAQKLADYFARRSEYSQSLHWCERAVSFLSRAQPPATREERKELERRVDELRKRAPD
jgi:hypothetical protein